MASTNLIAARDSEKVHVDRKVRLQEKVVQHAAERGVLLVRVKDLPPSAGGMLSEGQRRWLTAAPYDCKTENPLVHKHGMEAARLPSHVVEREEAKLEVQSLLDRPATPPPSSGIAEKIKESRRERHDRTVEDMKQELAKINSELEPRILEASEQLKSQLAENDKVLDGIFARISSNEHLQEFTLDELHILWEEVASQSGVRRTAIHELDSALSQIEVDRSKMVCEVLSGYARLLQATAYLLPADVQRLMEEEAHAVNIAIIANRRTYTQLCQHLTTSDFVREREQRQRWEAAVGEWRELVLQTTLQKFQGYMASDTVQRPTEAEKLREFLAAEQGRLTRRREELLKQLGSLRPPRATKTAVYEWNETALRLHSQLEHVHSSYLLQLQACQESVSRACEEEMEKYREHLVATGAYDTTSVYEMMTQHFLPLVEQHMASAREELQNIERSLEVLVGVQRAQFQSLSQFAQGAAHLWDTHTNTLATTERTFQEGLERCRCSHDSENQNREANLDVVLDRLRQGASREALGECLQEALRLLGNIREGYESFHSVMLSEVGQFPSLVQKELDSYDSALCNYLGVNRMPPKKKKSKILPSRSSDLSPSRVPSRAESKASRKLKPSHSRATPSLHSRAASSSLSSREGSLPAIVEEVVSTSRGTSFYIHTSLEDQRAGPAAFLTQDEEMEGASQSFATENIAIPDQAFMAARSGLRGSFLDHLEQWRAEMTEKAREVVTGKEEEAHTELELRLHLHQPRPSRVEQDIHNVRAAELVAHSDRVSRHAKGVVASLSEQKTLLQALAEEHHSQAERFSEDMDSLESALATASKTNGLLKVKSQAQKQLEKHLQRVEEASSQHQASAEGVITTLASSNNSFRTSLKPFSEGGNYCPEEIELFSRKMDKLTAKIATTQSLVSTEVESLTRAQRTTAADTMAKFEAQFQLHFSDLSFLEQVSVVLTRAQVRIKSEVAASNSQARRLLEDTRRLERKVGESSNSQPGREEMDPAALLSELPPLLSSFSSRMDYLYCKAAVYQGARVGFHTEVSAPSLLATQTRTQGPISAVNVTKSILEHTSARRRFGPEGEATGGSQLRTAAPSVMGSLASIDTKGSAASSYEESQRRSGRQSRRKQPPVERKNISFGLGGGEDGSNYFLPVIRGILKETHTQLYSMAEEFYKQKGSRAITRPNEVHESFESCVDSLIARTQGYRRQAEEYRNDCIEEFRSQLDSLESVLLRVPPLVLGRVRDTYQHHAEKERGRLSHSHQVEMAKMEAEKASHKSSLRPALGHPSQSARLEELCVREEERHQKTLGETQNHAHTSRENECSHAQSLAQELVKTAVTLLSLFDSLICTSEVIPGSGKLKVKPPLEELLREHVKPEQKVKEAHSTTAHGKGTWPGLPEAEIRLLWDPGHVTSSTNEIEASGTKSTMRKKRPKAVEEEEGGASTPSLLTETVSSRKSTAVHKAVIRSRDKAFQEFVVFYKAELERLKQHEEEEKRCEERWSNNWRTSVQRVRELHL